MIRSSDQQVNNVNEGNLFATHLKTFRVTKKWKISVRFEALNLVE